MTDKVKLRDEIKKEIRALLLSSPVGLSIRELARDFKEFIFGKDIPYRELGYNTLEDLLKDMPDAVVTSWTNGQMILKAVADSSTQHIQDLVSKQKVTKTKKWDSLRRKPPGRGLLSSRPRRPVHPPEPFIPAWLRNYIAQCLNSYPEGIYLNHFEDIFYRHFSTRVDYRKCGFRTLADFFHHLHDLVETQETRLGLRIFALRPRHNQREPYQNKHFDRRPYGSEYSRDVHHDKKPRNAFQVPEERRYDSNPHNSFQVPEERRYDSNRGSCRNSTDIPRLPKCSVWDEVQQYKVARPKSVTPPPSPEDLRNAESPEPPDENESNFTFVDSIDSGVSEQLQSELKELTKFRPKGIWAARLPFEYKNKFGKQLCIKDSGYMSVIEFVSALPNVFKIERPNPKGDWLLFDVNSGEEIVETSKCEATKQLRKKDRSIEEQQKEQKEIIKGILEKHSSGILMSDFLKVYKDETGKALPLEQIGFSHLESLLLSLTDTVLQLVYEGDAKMMIYPIEKSEEEEEIEQVDVIDKPLEAKHKLFSIPEDAVGHGCSYTQVPIKNHGDYIEIYVSYVVNPGVFWVQFRGKNTTIKLEELMDSIDFYNSNDGDRYIMPDSMIVVGQICAVLFPEDENWHRGVICGLRDGDFVEVYYVDYGNTCTVHKTYVRFLKNCYLHLPAQAVQARLANIKPVGQKWSLESRNELLSLCTHKVQQTNKPLVAMITSVERNVMSLCLIDTTVPGLDVHINDHLVNKNHAVLSPDKDNQLVITSHPEIPDYNLLYGYSSAGQQAALKSPEPTTVKDQAQSQAIDNQTLKERFIIEIQLTEEHRIHLINFDRQPWVTQAEVSALFEGENVRSMVGIEQLVGHHLGMSSLLKSKLNIKKIVISKEDHQELFKELVEYDLTQITDDGRPKPFITLYDLNGIPELLKYYKHPNQDLHNQVAELILSYSPDDPYWTGEEDLEGDYYDFAEVSDESPQSPNIELEKSLSYDDLEVNLQSLQFRRKRILQSMMSETIQEVDIAEMNDVEMKIMKTKEILERFNRRKDTTLSPVVQKVKGESDANSTKQLSGELQTKMKINTSEPPSSTKTPTKVQVGKVTPSPKTNVVLPMVVNPQPNLSSSSTVSSSPSAPQASSASTTANINTSLNLTQQQLLYQQMQLQQQQQQLMMGMIPNLMMPQMAANLLSAQGQTMGHSGFPQMQGNLVQSDSVLSGLHNIPRMPTASIPPGIQLSGQQHATGLTENPLLRANLGSQNIPRMPSNFSVTGQQGGIQGIPSNFTPSSSSSTQPSNPLNIPALQGNLLNNPSIRLPTLGRGHPFSTQAVAGEMPILPGLGNLLENYMTNLGHTSSSGQHKPPGDTTGGLNQQ